MTGCLQDSEEEQNLVARLIHQLRSEDLHEHFQILSAAKDRLQRGGAARLKHTLPSLANDALMLAKRISKAQLTAGKQQQDSSGKTDSNTVGLLSMCLLSSATASYKQHACCSGAPGKLQQDRQQHSRASGLFAHGGMLVHHACNMRRMVSCREALARRTVNQWGF